MNAVILAGGKGTRLYPLTQRIPKPLVNFLGRPVLEHQIELLKRQGIDDIIITVGHLKHRIMDYFGDGQRFGVSIRYVTEDTPLGTAGGVKQAEPLLHDTFVIISGDAVTDVDLRPVIAFHEANEAAATLILKDVEDPSGYGILDIDSTGRILRFLEKPSADQVFSRTANTGMYVMNCSCLRYIPEHEAFDFSKHLFPLLMIRNERLFGYRLNSEYWNDIGTLTEYLRAHIDALWGKVNLPLIGPSPRIPASAVVHPGARIQNPCIVGDGVQIDADAIIGENAIVGSDARIGASATLKYCVVGEGCSIGEHSVLEDCILSPGTTVPAGSQVNASAFNIPRPSGLAVYSWLDGPVVALAAMS